MIILIVLIILTGIGVWLIYIDKLIGLGAALITVFGMYLIMHIIFWFTASYNYHVMVVERQSFISTLDYARKNGGDLERAAIVKEITAWNQILAKEKYNNTTFFLKDYVDDRIVNIEPIK